MTIFTVKIVEIRSETPSVKVLKIDLLGQEFHYKAGQWIDCYADIEGVRMIVGYSLASSPTMHGFIELAVKISENPVTSFIHEKAKVSDTLYIEGGKGEVFYEKNMGNSVVLIAAGIGMAPLMGILRYIDEATDSSVVLFQSAISKEELIYFDEIIERSSKNPHITYIPTVTQEEPSMGIKFGRITGEMLEKHHINPDSFFYISGPDTMVPDLKTYLLGIGVEDSRIKYESWW